MNKVFENEQGVVYCGDCFEIMPRLEPVNAIITDPPYGYLKHRIETGVNIKEFIWLSYKVLKDDTFFVFFGLQPYLSFWVIEALKRFKYKKEIIWYKRYSNSPVHEIQRVFENIMLFVKGNKRFIDDWRTITRGYKARDLVSFAPENRRLIGKGIKHPTVKPVSLMKWLIALTTNKGDVILDPFAGSGTTAIAALEMNRKFILIEKDPEYCNLAVKRIKNYFGV